jgi:hypothetical protein
MNASISLTEAAVEGLLGSMKSNICGVEVTISYSQYVMLGSITE